jgi:hypothetical protein
MLRLVLLVLCLSSSLPTLFHLKIGGGWDPNGLKSGTPPVTPPGEIGGGLDPDGLTTQPPPSTAGDIGGGWDPNG